MTISTIESPAAPPRNRTHGASAWRPAVLDRTILIDAYGTHRSAAYSLAYRILGDGASAEDAVQDAFVKLWTGAVQFDASRGSMRGLLLTITRHTSIDVIRRRVRRQRTESTYQVDATYVIDGPERATECADDARHLRDALMELPAEQRCAIEMAYFSGLTRREIAASGSVPIGTVKSRMRLGMKKLASTLADRSGVASCEDRAEPAESNDERIRRSASRALAPAG